MKPLTWGWRLLAKARWFAVLACGSVAALAVTPPLEASREYLVHVWKTDHGLPQNWVSSIAQTPDGYLWIGTRYGGLARFDGVRFVTFGPQNTRELQDVQVEHLSVDAAGRLWVIMGNQSVTCVDHNRFTLARAPRAEPRLRADHVLTASAREVLFAGEYAYLARLELPNNRWTLLNARTLQVDSRGFLADASGALWCLTRQHQLARWRRDHFEPLPGAPSPLVSAVVGANGHLWAASARQVFEWIKGMGFVDRTPAAGAAPEAILQLAATSDGGLWVMERTGLRKLRAGRWVSPAVVPEFAASAAPGTLTLHGDASGDLWAFGDGRDLWHVKADGTVSKLTEETGLPGAKITCWFQDAEQNIWVGTMGGGIARIRECHFHSFGANRGLPGTVVSSTAVDPTGALWAGTMSGGLARLHSGRYVPIALPSRHGTRPRSITVLPDVDGSVWVGSINQGLLRWRDGTLTREALPWSSVRVLFGDRRGRLWVGGLVNLCCLDHGRVTEFGAAQGFVDSQAIGAIAEDSDGILWVGTGPGDLWRYDGRTFTRFTPPAEWPSVRISAVLPDRDGVVWVGTLGGGLLRFENGKFTRATRANGLPDDNICQLLDSGDGHVWAGTYAGIFRADKNDLAALAAGRTERVPIQVYGRFDGLPALECSTGFQPSCWRWADGRLCFSTADGVVTVDPRDITENVVPPKVIIEELLVDGKSVDLASASGDGGREIGPGRHYVQFGFTGVSFAAPDGVRFRVRLTGVDREWRSIGRERLVGYGPLPPGRFRFEVLACNNDGAWSSAGDALELHVLPYFWETWWFKATVRAVALAALVGAVAAIQRQRYRRRLQHLERQREVERERARIARDLHDDLGTSLTQIGMLSALANHDRTAPAEARELVQQVHGRARAMVTALDEIVWAVNPKNDSWSELASYLTHFAEEFFRPTTIRCRLDIPVQLPPHPLAAEIRHALFLAFKEALNNAARHSGATQVQVRLRAAAAEVVISIEDNGRGFDRAAPAAGRARNGLTNMQRRLEQLGGRCDIESVPGGGTTVALRLPLSPQPAGAAAAELTPPRVGA